MDLAQVMEVASENRIKEMTIEMATATMTEIISNHAVVSLIEEARISREDQGMIPGVTVATE